MTTFPVKTKTGADGTLHLTIPTGLPDAEVEVLVVVEAKPAASSEWPPGVFETYFGALKDIDFRRHPQGQLEDREIFD